jgi:hypothetical protein
MSRIRTIKPDLLRHEGLFDAEKETGMPLRIAFVGLLTCCDREGRFKWKPRRLKLDVLPYDDVDFEGVLDELVKRGFVLRYEFNGEVYGCVPSFLKHQRISGSEAAQESVLPPPPESGNTQEALRKHLGNTQEILGSIEEALENHSGSTKDPWRERKGVRNIRKGVGREGNTLSLSPHNFNVPNEWIEFAALLRRVSKLPELPHEHIVMVARKFEIHYQGSNLAAQELFVKWKEWVVTENSHGGNSKHDEKARQSALDRAKFLGNGTEAPHERV